MADKKEQAADSKPGDQAAAPKKGKRAVFAGAGALTVVALAYLAALMAVPSKSHEHRLEGPFVAKLSKTEIQANLTGADGKRYVVMSLQAEYYSYDQAYVQGRLGGGDSGGHGGGGTEDPLYLAMLKHALITLAGTKTLEQVTDPLLVDSFLEEIRKAVDPILFPVCVGDSHSPHQPDSRSGLRVGESVMESTLRGFLHEHELRVDSRKLTVALDGGEPASIDGPRRDLKVTSPSGHFVFLDTSQLEPDFTGAVPVGVPGKLRHIFKESFLIQ